jgi:hypothetical protein
MSQQNNKMLSYAMEYAADHSLVRVVDISHTAWHVVILPPPPPFFLSCSASGSNVLQFSLKKACIIKIEEFKTDQ